MNVFKLLTVPAVLLASVLIAAPASAHSLENATISVACGTGDHAGQICVRLTGDIEQGNEARFVFVDVFAHGSSTSLGEARFDLPAFNGTAQGCSANHCDLTRCFPAITGTTAKSFDIKIVKVTSDEQGMVPSDLVIHLPNGQEISFPRDTPAPVGTLEQPCAATAATPTPTPAQTGGSGGGSPAPTPTANTTVALAQTGGFDFRLPLIGLALLVAGGALLAVGASRGRTARTR